MLNVKCRGQRAGSLGDPRYERTFVRTDQRRQVVRSVRLQPRFKPCDDGLLQADEMQAHRTVHTLDAALAQYRPHRRHGSVVLFRMTSEQQDRTLTEFTLSQETSTIPASHSLSVNPAERQEQRGTCANREPEQRARSEPECVRRLFLSMSTSLALLE